MKLSKAQTEVMNKAKADIDYARTHDFIYWIAKATGHNLDVDWDSHPNPYFTNEQVRKDAEEIAEKDANGDGYWLKRYEEVKNGTVLTSCNSRTLYKLEEYGLIEIIDDSTGQTYGIDRVKVLNY